jgi:hypothetical protein
MPLNASAPRRFPAKGMSSRMKIEPLAPSFVRIGAILPFGVARSDSPRAVHLQRGAAAVRP